MPSRLIKLSDGILVEVDVIGDQVEQVGNAVFDQVEQSLDQIGDVSQIIVRSIAERMRSFADLMTFEDLEVEYGLSFSGEGNIYVAKLSTSTSIKVKLTLKPSASAGTGPSAGR